MNVTQLPLALSFVFGVLSIISPCVIVLLPAYLATITGFSIEELTSAEHESIVLRRILGNALGFILGFFLVFIPLGALIGVAATAIGSARSVFAVVAGVIVVLLGMNFLYPLPFLRWINTDVRIRWKPRGYSFISNIFFGAVFAFVWTPCVGPYLVAVTALVGSTGDIGKGVAYFSLYALGLAISMLVFTVFYTKVAFVTNFLKQHSRSIQVISGILLITIGILMISDKLYLTNIAINKFFGGFQPESWFINS